MSEERKNGSRFGIKMKKYCCDYEAAVLTAIDAIVQTINRIDCLETKTM